MITHSSYLTQEMKPYTTYVDQSLSISRTFKFTYVCSVSISNFLVKYCYRHVYMHTRTRTVSLMLYLRWFVVVVVVVISDLNTLRTDYIDEERKKKKKYGNIYIAIPLFSISISSLTRQKFIGITSFYFFAFFPRLSLPLDLRHGFVSVARPFSYSFFASFAYCPKQ